MTDSEELTRLKHRLEEAEMRDRSRERKLRTRRLIQLGAILEKAVPEICSMEPEDIPDFLKSILSR